jgi:hypothetical protein
METFRHTSRVNAVNAKATLRAGDYFFNLPVKNLSLGGVFLKGFLKDHTTPNECEVDLHFNNGLSIESLKVKFIHDRVVRDNPEATGSGFEFVKLDNQNKSKLFTAISPEAEKIHYIY